jgi:hypothetical protein
MLPDLQSNTSHGRRQDIHPESVQLAQRGAIAAWWVERQQWIVQVQH